MGCQTVCRRRAFRKRKRSSGPTFLPSDISGLTAWFQYGVGITEAGSGVSVWADQSGNGNDFLQGTDANRPSKEADGSILFDGVDHFLRTAFFTLNQPITAYFLFRKLASSLNQRFFDGGSAGNYSFLVWESLSEDNRFSTDEGVNWISANPDIVIDEYTVLTAIANGASSFFRTNTSAAVSGNVGVVNPGGLTVGSNATGTENSNMQVKEVILYAGAHDTNQQNMVIDYLSRFL